MSAVASVFADDTINRLQKQLPSIMPGLTVDSIKPSPIQGLYQVIAGHELLYVSADGKHVISGMIFDSVKKTNLTEEAKNEVRAKVLKSMDKSQLMVFKAKDKPVDVITVFTDPSCPYCRQLHGEVAKLTEQNIEVRYVVFSREGAASAVSRSIEAALCDKTPVAAINKLMTESAPPAPGACNNPAIRTRLENFNRWANEIGAQGTPYIVSQSGRAIPGYRPATEIARLLKEPTAP